MALIDLYRRYMYGQAPGMSVDTGDAPATGMGTSGLFGTGGEPGRGGLLTTFDRPDSSGLLDVFSNPFVTIGLSGLQRGMAGQDISQAALPAVTEGFRTSSAVEKIQAAKKKKEFIKEYADQVPPEDKEMFMAFPEKYVTAVLSQRLKKPTLNDEILNVYNKVKGLSGDAFDEAFKKLSDAEKSVYRNKIEGNVDYIDRLIQDSMEKLNKPVILETMPDEKSLTINQLYQIKNKFYRWDGKEMKLVPNPQ
jgi:hypothetical protein